MSSVRYPFQVLYLFIAILSPHIARSYELQSYNLIISPDFSNKRLSVTAEINIGNPQRETEFTFGLNRNYDQVEVISPESNVTIERSEDWIGVTTPKPLPKLQLVFKLAGQPGKSVDENRNVIEAESLFLLWSDRFYPIDFTHWARVKTTVILPAGFQVIAPGILNETVKGEKQMEYRFEAENPEIDFSVFADRRWIKTEREINGIQMQTLLHPQSQKFAEQIFASSSEILKFYSETLAPYPSARFSFITIEGMFARRCFADFIGYTPEYMEKEFTTTGYDAHETALLWWGHLIRGAGPGSFQWLEGFGDYSEILYGERFHKPLPANFQKFRALYLAVSAESDLFFHDLRGNTNQALVHGKYPWLMHLIRFVVGEEPFRRALKHAFEKCSYRTSSMEEFIAALEEGSGQSLQWFREDWLQRKGVPSVTLNYSVREKSGGYEIAGTLEQMGNLFRLPVEIGLETKSGMRLERVHIAAKTTKFTFISKEKPSRILLDPANWILMKKVER